MHWLAHRRLRRAVSAFVDGELESTAAAVVGAHLRDCWACSGDAELALLVKRSLCNLADRHRDALAAARVRRFATGLGD